MAPEERARKVGEQLSAREREILELVATGATNQQIALALHISVNTVKAHLRNIFAKLEVDSRTEATLYAIQHGLVRVPLASSGQEESSPRESEALPSLMNSLRWPHQLLALGALLLFFLLVFWPIRQAESSPISSNRFIDRSGASASTEKEFSRWHTRAQMPTPRGRFAQAEVEGIIYVIGGLTDEGWTSQVEAYDPLQDLWQRRAPKPTAVANIGAAVVGGQIFVPGGLDSSGTVRNILEVYDPRTDRWREAAPLPVPLCAYAIAPFEKGFFVFGGWDGHRYLDKVYFYDAERDSWKEGIPMRRPRGFAAAATVGKRIYLVGGYDGHQELALCESYDPTFATEGRDPWSVHRPMRTGRAGHSMVALQGNLYVIGGGWDHPFMYNERYDVANDLWATFESPIIGEWRTLGLSVIQSREGAFLYAIGGWSGRYLGVVKAYQAFFRVYIP